MIPTSWTNRTSGVPKLAMKEMGSRYLFIVLYVWLENALSRGDYQVRKAERREAEESRTLTSVIADTWFPSFIRNDIIIIQFEGIHIMKQQRAACGLQNPRYPRG